MIADFSEYQGNVDWSKVKGKIDGAILRVQAGYTHNDTKYLEYVAGCKRYGIPFGTYAYFKGVSVADSILEAKNALKLMDKQSQFFVLDIESPSMSDLVSGGQAFIDYLKNNGVQKVGLYSGEYFFKENNLDKIKRDFTWIANYSKQPSIPFDLWQYTSSGRLEGVIGNIDLSKGVNLMDNSKVPSEWAKEAWAWGLENGFIDFVSNPHDTATQEIVVNMLYRLFKNKGLS